MRRCFHCGCTTRDLFDHSAIECQPGMTEMEVRTMLDQVQAELARYEREVLVSEEAL